METKYNISSILREGFEVVLFYSALIGSAIYNMTPVIVGAGFGLMALIFVYFGLNKIVKVILIGAFFRVFSILHLILSIYFAYEGIYEFKEGLEHLV
jgi:high-affinity iron transporter